MCNNSSDMVVVSVLMPTYNHENFIAESIKSFLRQEVKFDIELLIGDDCSTDQTSSIALSFAEQYPSKIHYFHYNENRGLMQNYKYLLEHAKGKYIAILESDDVWLDCLKLQKQVDIFEKNKNVGLVCSNWYVIDEKSKKIEESKVPLNNNYSELLKANFMAAVTVLFSRQLFNKYCNIDDYIKFKFKTFDYPVWLSISAHSDIIYLTDYTAGYRCLSTSISNSNDIRKSQEFNESIDDITSYIIGKYGSGDLSLKELQNAKRWRYMIQYLFHGHLYAAFKEAISFKVIDRRTFFIKYFSLVWFFRNRQFWRKRIR